MNASNSAEVRATGHSPAARIGQETVRRCSPPFGSFRLATPFRFRDRMTAVAESER
jgi:hypothetical protein